MTVLQTKTVLWRVKVYPNDCGLDCVELRKARESYFVLQISTEFGRPKMIQYLKHSFRSKFITAC